MQLQDAAGEHGWKVGWITGWGADRGWVCVSECERGVRLRHQGGHGAAKEIQIRGQEEEQPGVLTALRVTVQTSGGRGAMPDGRA